MGGPEEKTTIKSEILFKLEIKKIPQTNGSGDFIFRGPERIRTAVRGFADLCLAARPQDPLCD